MGARPDDFTQRKIAFAGKPCSYSPVSYTKSEDDKKL